MRCVRKTCLCAIGDLESRCLDLVLGVENQPLFNICDAVDGRCEAADAICKHERVPRLYFMPAPAFYPEAVGSKQTDEVFTPDAVKAFLGAIAALPEKIDTVVCDLPARPDGLYRSLVPSADKILVVSMHNAVSIWRRRKNGIALHELCTGTKKPEVFLAVNGLWCRSVRHAAKMPGYMTFLCRQSCRLSAFCPMTKPWRRRRIAACLPVKFHTEKRRSGVPSKI